MSEKETLCQSSGKEEEGRLLSVVEYVSLIASQQSAREEKDRLLGEYAAEKTEKAKLASNEANGRYRSISTKIEETDALLVERGAVPYGDAMVMLELVETNKGTNALKVGAVYDKKRGFRGSNVVKGTVYASDLRNAPAGFREAVLVRYDIADNGALCPKTSENK